MTRKPLSDVERTEVERALRGHEAIAMDLRDVLKNGWPSLPDAPQLDNWCAASTTVDTVEGEVGGTWVYTAPAVAFSSEARVLRTAGGWYRLGDRLEIIPTCEIR